MFDDGERRSESFNQQLGDALMPDVILNSRASPVWSDSVSRSFANDLGGNRPSLGQRAVFGGPNLLSSLQQFLNDRIFGR